MYGVCGLLFIVICSVFVVVVVVGDGCLVLNEVCRFWLVVGNVVVV